MANVRHCDRILRRPRGTGNTPLPDSTLGADSRGANRDVPGDPGAGKVREKFTRVDEMLEAAGAESRGS